MLVSGLIQLAAIARTVLLAHQHGATRDLDTFYLASAITVTSFNIVGAAVTTVLIPELVRGTNTVTLNKYLRWVRLVSLVLSGVALLLATVGAPIIARDYSSDHRRLLAALVAMLCVGQVMRVGTAFATAELQTSGHFVRSRLVNLIPAVLPTMWLLVSSSLFGLALVIVGSYVFEWLLSVAFAKGKNRPGAGERLTNGSSDYTALRRTTWPILISSGLFQFQMALFVIVAGWFGPGMATLYSNAAQLIAFMQAIVIQNVVTLAYPRIAAWVQNDPEGASWMVPRVVALALVVLSGIGWVFYSIGLPALGLAFGRGNFSDADVRQLYDFGLLLLASVPISLVRDFMYRVLYARSQARIAARNSVIVVIFNLVCTAILVRPFGIYSIFIALILGNCVSLIGAWWVMRRIQIDIRWNDVVRVVGYLSAVFVAAALIVGRATEIHESFAVSVRPFFFGGLGIVALSVPVVMWGARPLLADGTIKGGVLTEPRNHSSCDDK